MAEQTDRSELTEEELEKQRAEELPDREVMSLVQVPTGHIPTPGDGYTIDPPPDDTAAA